MQLSGDEYEQLVKELIDPLRADNDLAKLELIGYGKKNKIEGASGHKHQIDIAYRDPSNQGLMLIECKGWESKIEVGQVLEFHGRVQDIQEKEKVKTEGVMITTIGYQPGAKRSGDHLEIKLGRITSESEFGLFIRNSGFLGVIDGGVGKDEVSVKIVTDIKPDDGF